MLISYPAEYPEQAQPQECACNNRKFHGHGKYWRIIARQWIYQFMCTLCHKHVSMVPSTCIPYKHHPASDIQAALDNVLKHGCSAYDLECQRLGVHASCIYRWVKEFSCHSGVLATEGARRLKIKPFSGSFKQVYQRLSSLFCSDKWLISLQPALCTYLPPLGIFRPLIFSSA